MGNAPPQTSCCYGCCQKLSKSAFEIRRHLRSGGGSGSAAASTLLEGARTSLARQQRCCGQRRVSGEDVATRTSVRTTPHRGSKSALRAIPLSRENRFARAKSWRARRRHSTVRQAIGMHLIERRAKGRRGGVRAGRPDNHSPPAGYKTGNNSKYPPRLTSGNCAQ